MTTDPEKPVYIARCDNATEAEMLKTALEMEGVKATLDGDALNATFGVLYGPVISSMKLIVRQRDAVEAAKIIKATRDSWIASDQEPWFCGVCREEIDGGFDICWCCGGIREDVESEFPTLADSIEPENFGTVDASDLGRRTENPYESPRAIGAAEVANPDHEQGPAKSNAESKILLGLMFSLGCVVLPVIPALAAGAVFRDVLKRKLPLSIRAKFIFCLSVAIIIAVHVFWYRYLAPQI